MSRQWGGQSCWLPARSIMQMPSWGRRPRLQRVSTPACPLLHHAAPKLPTLRIRLRCEVDQVSLPAARSSAARPLSQRRSIFTHAAARTEAIRVWSGQPLTRAWATRKWGSPVIPVQSKAARHRAAAANPPQADSLPTSGLLLCCGAALTPWRRVRLKAAPTRGRCFQQRQAA